MPKQYAFQWSQAGSLDAKVSELISEPNKQLLRIIDSYGEMAAATGVSFGFSQPIDVMCLGVPGLILDEVRNNTSFEPFREVFKKHLTQALTEDRQPLHPPPDVMAEPSVAALLQRQGWMVKKLPESRSRTPDLMAMRDGCEMEVEVVASLWKPDEKQRYAAIQRRIEEVPRRSDATVVVAVVDELKDEEADHVAAAVAQLRIGEIAEERDRWRVSLVPPDQQDAPEPEWWPKQYVQPFMTSLNIGSTRRRVTFRWGISYSTYRNSPLGKINRSQFTGTRPSLIAWDVSDLSGALQWARENGLELLGEHNEHISGLLAFGAGLIISAGEVRWWYLLIENPHARIPLPAKVLEELDGEVAVRLYGATR